MAKDVQVGPICFSQTKAFVLISGPCQIESRDHCLGLAEDLVKICHDLAIPLVFKASFDKANRSSGKAERGIGIDAGLKILQEVKNQFNIPIITDIHDIQQCEMASEIVDILQIPAFLCRQTDLLIAAGHTKCAIHVKKGQFLAPWDMQHVAEKIASTGNDRILLCDRGTSFGYNTLVSDFRGLPIMAQTGYPVIFDATHSVQQPGGMGASSGGQREFVETLARAALSVGVAGLFIETHEDPDKSPSDGPNMIALGNMSALLSRLQKFDRLSKSLFSEI